MAFGNPQKVTNQLIGRLNVVRHWRTDARATALDQVEFKASGLKNKDRPGFIAVNSMIAALRVDRPALLDYSKEMETNYPEEVFDRMNVLRSIACVGMRDEAATLALRLVKDLHDPDELYSLGSCLMTLGLNEQVVKIFDDLGKERGFDPDMFFLYQQARLTADAGISEKELSDFFSQAYDFCERNGWAAAPIVTKAPHALHDGDACRSMLSIAITAEPDEVERIEDIFLEDLYASEHRLFMDGVIACSVHGWDEDDHSE